MGNVEDGEHFDVHKGTGSAIALEALKRIGELYDIEVEITGQSAGVRRAARQSRSKPKVEAFGAWAEDQLKRIPGKSDLAKAFRYGLNRWESFCLFLDDGRVAIDNNPAERKMKPIALGRKNFLFAGSDAGGETLADTMTVIETALCRPRHRAVYAARRAMPNRLVFPKFHAKRHIFRSA